MIETHKILTLNNKLSQKLSSSGQAYSKEEL